MLSIRIDPDLKSRIEEAAARKRKTVSAFVLEAAEQAALKALRLPVEPTQREHAPAFIRATCLTAKRGGARGYWAAGFELARHAEDLQPDFIEDHAQWEALVDRFSDLLSAGSNSRGTKVRPIILWMREYLPGSMKLIPARRHGQAALGAITCFDEDNMN